jgi:hypothetical protein
MIDEHKVQRVKTWQGEPKRGKNLQIQKSMSIFLFLFWDHKMFLVDNNNPSTQALIYLFIY